MKLPRRAAEHPQRDPTFSDYLTLPIDSRTTRRLLEFKFPHSLFFEVDVQGRYIHLGQPNLPGHVQLGAFLQQDADWLWVANSDQRSLIWQTWDQRDCTLHFISCSDDLEQIPLTIALIQHVPNYGRENKQPTVTDIDRVCVTSLWSPGMRERYVCELAHPCTCSIYQALQRIRAR